MVPHEVRHQPRRRRRSARGGVGRVRAGHAPAPPARRPCPPPLRSALELRGPDLGAARGHPGRAGLRRVPPDGGPRGTAGRRARRAGGERAQERRGRRPGPGRVTEIGQIGTAFARMLDDLRGSTERLEDLVFKLGALNEVVELAARVPNMQQLLALVLERTMRTVRAATGSIMLLDRKRGTLRVVAARGDDGDVCVGAEVPLGEGVAGKVAQLGELQLAEAGRLVCLPIRVEDRVTGVIKLAKGDASLLDPRAFSAMDVQFLSTLIAHVAYALENARLLEDSRSTTQRLQQVVEELRTAEA